MYLTRQITLLSILVKTDQTFKAKQFNLYCSICSFWPRPKSTYAIQHRYQNVKVELVSLIFGTFPLFSGVVVAAAVVVVVVRAMPNPFIIGLSTLMMVVVVW